MQSTTNVGVNTQPLSLPSHHTDMTPKPLPPPTPWVTAAAQDRTTGKSKKGQVQPPHFTDKDLRLKVKNVTKVTQDFKY